VAKDRVTPERITVGHELWWDESKELVTTHGASGVGDRAVRYAKKPPKPRWTMVAMLLSLVLIILAGTLLYQDYRRAVVEGHPPVRTTPASERPSGRVMGAASPDTIARKLKAKGFEVDYLASVADQRKLAYDVAETHIDGTQALILVFKDRATARRWVEGSDVPVVYKNAWAVTVPDQDLAGRLAQKMDADLQG
jgi:hypothetical protein